MPVPQGWTTKQARLRDRMAAHLEASGKVKEPWAVATNRVEKMREKERAKR